MKKALVFVLAIVLVLSLAMPAFAAGLNIQSPIGEDGLPLLITTTADKYQLVTIRDAWKLTKEEQQNFKDSLKDLPDAVPQGTNARYFFFLQVTEKCDAVFNINGFNVPIFMQYVDGEWVELDYVVNEDGTVTVKDVVNAPMAICFLTNGDTDPLLISASAKKYEIVITKNIEKLPEASQKALKDAFDVLFDVLEKRNEEAEEEEQLRLRYFFYLSTSETCDAVFNVDAAQKPVFQQFVNGEWVELAYTDNGDSTVTVKSVQDAPMAICFPKQAAAENK